MLARLSTLLLLSAVLITGCGKKSDSASGGGPKAIKNTWHTINTPDGALPNVADSLGGNGFETYATSHGWSTYTMKPEEQIYFGDPKAKTGGEIVFTSSRFVLSFRPFFFGPNSNFTENSIMASMSYQALLGTHPVTLDYTPALATHWKIDPDGQTFWFRIDPRARFWDGSRVTSADIIATWKLAMDPSLGSPSLMISYEKYDEPVAVSEYVLKVHSTERNWRSFQTFATGLPIMKADQISKLTGKEFAEKFHFDQPIGSGEYIILKDDIVKEQSFKYTRRDDFWAKDDAMNKYSGNFDYIKFIAIADNPTAEYETFKRGEADLFYYTSITIENWINDDKDEAVKKNWIQKRRIQTDGAAGAGGIYFNQRNSMLSDVRVRKALAYLYDREKICKEILYDEYVPYNTFHGNGVYDNKNNEKVTYNPEYAKQLLAEAGYTSRNSEGVLVRNGQPFILEMSIPKPVEKFVTVYQQTLKAAGIVLKLKFEDANAITKKIAERQFQLTWANYGGLTYPNPETSLSSKLADKNDNNNITGFKNPRVDQLIEEYKLAFNQADRVRIIQEVDGIVWSQFIAGLNWYPIGIKIGYWNKFGMPDYYFTRFTQAGDHDLAIMGLWWYDEAKANEVATAKKEKKQISGPGKRTDVQYWKTHKF